MANELETLRLEPFQLIVDPVDSTSGNGILYYIWGLLWLADH
jgi:hypothetical protein